MVMIIQKNLKLLSKPQKASIVANEIHIAANPEKYKIKDFSVLVLNPVLKINKKE